MRNKRTENNRVHGRGRRIASTVLIVVILLAGLGLLAYPSFSNWWNQRHQSVAIAGYQDAVEALDDTSSEEMLAAAEAYNAQLLVDRQNGSLTMGALTDEQVEEYNSLLDITGTGIMGYVRIPKIDVELPIYHGTDEAVLQIAVGHYEGSSLPVGGKGTHAVISGHRGLPSAELFTNIDSLGEGDIFIITCLNRKITYQVDQITTVLPSELDDLEIDPEEDYCTLVTCTPYGINSHRLLVRGHRIENLLDEDVETIEINIPERVLSTQERMQQYLPYAVILALGFLGLAIILPGGRKNRKDDGDDWDDDGRGRDGRGRGDRRVVDRDSQDDESWERRARERDARKARRDRVDLHEQLDDDTEFYDEDEDYSAYEEDEK